MELYSIIDDFHPANDTKLLGKADKLTPVLYHMMAEPVSAFQLEERYSQDKIEFALEDVPQIVLGKGDNLCLDFGTHRVGYVTLDVSFTGSHPDAPVWLKLKFAETLKELSENSDDYNGWISKSWIQEEFIHIDILPGQIRLPRRYAFRYLKITVMDTSPKYKLNIKHAECMTETSADLRKWNAVKTGDPMEDRIYDVSLQTLANCMQNVFEDGPKRDRRLWAGDLRLQALTNYVSFQNVELVKRCLYLFAGSRFPDGRISACLFTAPYVEADDTWFFDYSLYFVIILEEYLEQTDDREALNDLYDIAMQQIDLSLGKCENYLVMKEAVEATFIDWCDGLDKSASAQGVLIYAMNYACRIAERKQDVQRLNLLEEQIQQLKKAAALNFWDEDLQCFVSKGQVSIASQIWMVLADVLEPEKAHDLMDRAYHLTEEFAMVTPYMHHYYLMALIHTGHVDEAEDHMKAYWGSMIEAGADTFWEAWNPDDPEASPYGGSIINSYCHAWSCTPAYIIRKYFLDRGKKDAGK